MIPQKLRNDEVIKFKNLVFKIIQDRLYLVKCGNLGIKDGMDTACFNTVEASISGENKNTHLGAKMAYSTEWDKLFVVAYDKKEDGIAFILRSG